VRRARFKVEELVRVVLEFYRRNYIEGLFLSSGIIRNPDYTMEQLVAVARTLREEHRFHGYIHLKTIPNAAPELIEQAGRWADRLSVNVELPTQEGLDRLAPDKKLVQITGAMDRLKTGIDGAKEERKRSPRAPLFAPAGQSTQMIVGATDASDAVILSAASTLYRRQGLRRVYYSGFSPIPDASAVLPSARAPLIREHRLYQADWLMRFYGFDAAEVAPASAPDLDLELDPKTAWALRNRDRFPVDLNAAPKGILEIRAWHRIRLEDLARLGVSLRKTMPFVTTADHTPRAVLDAGDLRDRLFPQRAQVDLFASAALAATGEL
jgi:putative DNA modification/repair radical SAM protein